jgi:DNA-directed RNA polymerase specialized sigma24 family protein
VRRQELIVTEALPATQDADDAKLLNLVRAGDAAAFAVIVHRHEHAARRLAGALTDTPADADALVAETFALLLAISQRGGGPTDAVRPYVLTALRRMHADRLRYRQLLPPADDQLLLDPGATLIDEDFQGLADEPIVRAFGSLPERWCAVLWHTEIERAITSKVAPIFDLTRGGVAAVRRRAKEGLRQSYLQIYLMQLTGPQCAPTAERLGAFISDSLSVRETGEVSEHLAECPACRAVCAELADVSSALREKVAPVILGSAAAAYLSTADESAPSTTATGTALAAVPSPAGTAQPSPTVLAAIAAAAGGAARAGTSSTGAPSTSTTAAVSGSAGPDGAASGGGAGSGGTGGASTGGGSAGGGAGSGGGADASGGDAGGGWPDLTQWAAWASRPSRWLTAGVAGLLVIAAVVVAATLATRGTATSHHGPLASAGATPTVSAAATQPALQTSAPATPAASKPAASPSASPTTGTTAELAAPPPPAAAPTHAAASMHLAASVSVAGLGRWHGDQVDFQVSDTGSKHTAGITVTITLPAGSLMFGAGRHGGPDGASAWTCQPAAGGATCQHGSISAGGQAAGELIIGVFGGAACGQPVQITAASGSHSASASSGGIPC